MICSSLYLQLLHPNVSVTTTEESVVLNWGDDLDAILATEYEVLQVMFSKDIMYTSFQPQHLLKRCCEGCYI